MPGSPGASPVAVQKMSEGATPGSLYTLGIVFDTLDEVVSTLGAYKVETIGSEYMAVSGLPAGCLHPANPSMLMMSVAAAMIATVRNHGSLSGVRTAVSEWPCHLINTLRREHQIGLQIGVNTGRVVETILGRRLLPRWKLFGDTVNTAARFVLGGRVSRTAEQKYLPCACVRCRMKAYSAVDSVLASEACLVAAMGNEAPAFCDVPCETRVPWASNPAVAIIARPRMAIKGKGRLLTFWITPGVDGGGGEVAQSVGAFRVRVSVMVPLEQFAHTPRREDGGERSAAAGMVAAGASTPMRMATVVPVSSATARGIEMGSPKRSPSRPAAATDVDVRADIGVGASSFAARGRVVESQAPGASARSSTADTSPFRRGTTGPSSSRVTNARPRRTLRAQIEDFVSDMCAEELNKVFLGDPPEVRRATLRFVVDDVERGCACDGGQCGRMLMVVCVRANDDHRVSFQVSELPHDLAVLRVWIPLSAALLTAMLALHTVHVRGRAWRPELCSREVFATHRHSTLLCGPWRW